MARLVYNDPVTKQQMTVEIGPHRPVVVIGRNEDCTLRVIENSISRYHAVIRFQNGIVTVNDPPDKASVNGIFINGQRKPPYQETALPERCEVRCGAFPLYFMGDSDKIPNAPNVTFIPKGEPVRIQRSMYSLVCEDARQREGLADWVMGHAFAFYMGAEDIEYRVQYLGSKKIDLGHLQGHISVKANPVDMPKLKAVFTDRDLYKEGDDTTRVVVFAPGQRAASVELVCNGERLTTLDVEVDGHGLGLYELPGLMAGEYSLSIGESKTQFTVAGFSLAPLTAQLKGSQLSRDAGKETLSFHLYLETYGVPFGGDLAIEVMNLEHHPPKRVSGVRVFVVDGEVKGEVALQGGGPFELRIQARGDGLKTATVALAGSRRSERELLTLSNWGPDQLGASLLAFEGAENRRGIWVGKKDTAKGKAPIVVIEDGSDTLKIKACVELDTLCLVVFDPWSYKQTIHLWEWVDAGSILELPLKGVSPWALLMAGAQYRGKCWEGRAAFIARVGQKISVKAPESCAPGETVRVQLQGIANASAFLLVKDMRLQTVDSPTSATAASLRRQIQKGMELFSDQEVSSTLAGLIPQPSPPAHFNPQSSGYPKPSAAMHVMPGMPVLPVMPGMPVLPGMPGASSYPSSSGMPGLPSLPGMPGPPSAAPPGTYLGTPITNPSNATAPPTRQHFPEVMFAQIVSMDAQGQAEITVKMGEAIGLIAVEAFCVAERDWGEARAQIQVKRDIFGELILPRFVRRGDYAEGRLFVHNTTSAPVRVEVKRNGQPILLVSTQGSGTHLNLDSPGGAIAFAAEAGNYEARVQGANETDQTQGKVEEPGKLIWFQKALRMLMPGDSISLTDPGVLSLRMLPSLDKTFNKMVGGLGNYAHHCCEQTSAVLLAAAAAYLTAKDDDTKNKAANHIRACIARERTMYLPGKGFKGWPEYPPEVFRYSPGATLNLLQMEMFANLPMSKELKAAVDDCLLMARDAAKAHRIDTAPEHPKSAREAYGRFGKFLDDRQRMVAFIRERIEPWGKEMKAILKFELPAFSSETYHKTPAMIRAETAFGAATLIEAGSVHMEEGLHLANTVMGAVQENGSLYSTLDSVAAITLLTSMKRVGIVPSNDTQCELNGEPTTVAAAFQSDHIQSLRAVRGVLLVEVKRLVEEDFTTFNQGVQADIFLKYKGKAITDCSVGDSVDLVVKIKNDYEAGDLLHVFLPSALSWVHGGGQIKKCSFDFKGKTEINIPLAATSLTLDAEGNIAPQHFAVCIRNMYDERRGLGFDNLAITVSLSSQKSTHEAISWVEPAPAPVPIVRQSQPFSSVSPWLAELVELREKNNVLRLRLEKTKQENFAELEELREKNNVLRLRFEETEQENSELKQELDKQKRAVFNRERGLAELERRLGHTDTIISNLYDQISHLKSLNQSTDEKTTQDLNERLQNLEATFIAIQESWDFSMATRK